MHRWKKWRSALHFRNGGACIKEFPKPVGEIESLVIRDEGQKVLGTA